MIHSDIFHANRHEAHVRQKAHSSLARFQRASCSIAGGVSSSLRRSARPFPLFFEHGWGAHIQDVDGNVYLDYTLAWGPLILGHSPEPVQAAIAAHLKTGHTFGAQHDLEFEVGELIQSLVPCAERICFANSGTEIVQLALRLARAFTGCPKYLKFEGHYHGWDDSVLVSYHPSAAEIAQLGGSPVPVGAGQRAHTDVLVAEWNDRASVEAIFKEHGGSISAVICEPLLCNSGCIPPAPGFLEFLREITSWNNALLIFDEVITGFRLALGGAQQFYGVIPDLATFAKAVGGGFPLSVLAGKAAVMELIANGTVVHAGTLNGNPLALAAAKATLDTLRCGEDSIYKQLWSLGDKLRDGLRERLAAKGIPAAVNGGGPVFQISFQEETPRTYRDTLKANRQLYSDFVVALLDEGVLGLPDGRWYISAAHTESDVEQTLAAVDRL
jgi:glutamate-1-semialdehyde 2,1-aminomutase